MEEGSTGTSVLPDSVRTNLVPPASSFVGRISERRLLSEVLDTSRLVTLQGPGGMGKTRLAIQCCEDQLPVYTGEGAGGLWFVDLSVATSVSSAISTVAGVLGVELVGLSRDDEMERAVGEGIRRLGPVLIVLDNVEQIADALAPVIDGWVRRARSARFLVTSRVVLDVPGEQLLALGPLSRDDAAELFVGRAQRIAPNGPVEERALIEEIVEAIDRMPLAIELAASRTRVLSPTDLRDRLERPLEVLRGAKSDARHGSMKRTILDPVTLLAPSARRLFALASVLRNGFTAEDLEAIVGDRGLARGEVLDALDALVRTSLLQVRAEAGQAARYRFFETIRGVAEELALADEAREAVVMTHARHFARKSIDRPAMDRELENFLFAHRTALRLASDAQDVDAAEDALRIARRVEPLLSARGLSQLRAELFEGVLTAIETAEGSASRSTPAALTAEGSLSTSNSSTFEVRARAHLGRGFARRELGETALAREDFERALALAEEAELSDLSAVALTQLGGIQDVAGDTGEARACLEAALALLKGSQSDERPVREAEALLLLGHAHRREGNLSDARRAIRAAADRYRSLAHDEGLAAALYELGAVEMFGGAIEASAACFDEGLSVARRRGLRVMEGALTTARGCLLQDKGELADALEHHAAAARIFGDLGSRFREASALFYLATTFVERGEPAEALAVLHQSRARVAGVGAPRYDALLSACSATVLAMLDRLGEAEEELQRADAALRAVTNEPSLGVAVALHRRIVEVRSGRAEADVLSSAETLVRDCPNDDTRCALRVLRGLVAGDAPASVDALVVWPEGRAFQTPKMTKPVVLPDRSPLRAILDRLVVCRTETPGRGLAIDEIIEAGWPGERIGATAALNRGYVALTTLRKKGLRGILVKTEGGYALSQAVIVRRGE
ncbi:MAG: tetratricopeptide repeat protein [Myxococcota bacterium]